MLAPSLMHLTIQRVRWGEIIAALAAGVLLLPSGSAHATPTRSLVTGSRNDERPTPAPDARARRATTQALSTASRQDEPLADMDRPGFVNVTQAAPVYSLISEQTLQVALPTEHVEFSAPLMLLRFGLLSWLEVRTQLPSSVFRFADEGRPKGFVDDWRFGAVAALDLGPQVSVSAVPTVAIPLGTRDAGALGVDANLQLNLAWSLATRVSVAFAAQAGVVHVERATRRPALLHGMAGGFLDVSLHPRLKCFVQANAQYVQTASVVPVLGGGLAWWVLPHFQLNAEANSGLGAEAPPATLAVGAGVQWW